MQRCWHNAASNSLDGLFFSASSAAVVANKVNASRKRLARERANERTNISNEARARKRTNERECLRGPRANRPAGWAYAVAASYFARDSFGVHYSLCTRRAHSATATERIQEPPMQVCARACTRVPGFLLNVMSSGSSVRVCTNIVRFYTKGPCVCVCVCVWFVCPSDADHTMAPFPVFPSKIPNILASYRWRIFSLSLLAQSSLISRLRSTSVNHVTRRIEHSLLRPLIWARNDIFELFFKNFKTAKRCRPMW